MASNKTTVHSILFLIALLIAAQKSVSLLGDELVTACSSRPKAEESPICSMACPPELVGVLTTLDAKKAPFGNVMSYADAGTGTPYFYLSMDLDPTGEYAVNNSLSSFTLSESVLGCCNATTDPQSPFCSKITLSGNLKLLQRNTEEARFGEDALFRSTLHFEGFLK